MNRLYLTSDMLSLGSVKDSEIYMGNSFYASLFSDFSPIKETRIKTSEKIAKYNFYNNRLII